MNSAPSQRMEWVMFPFPSIEQLREIILLARREDLSLSPDDVTSRLMIDENAMGVGTLLQKEIGVTAGLPIVEMICRTYDERLRVEPIPGFHLEIIEGRYSDARQTPLIRVRGPLRSLLAAERVILNFLQRMSGVATATHRLVKRIEGTGAKVFDTRKTTPGFRLLDKYAVRCGGGHNHRVGLYDAILVKDNHLASIGNRELAAAINRLVQRSREEAPGRIIEVEVTSLEQFREVLKVEGVHIIMLDNMDCPNMIQAVAMRDAQGLRGKVELEASGGVTIDTIRTIAQTGVERISVGAITHSASALDISFEMESA
jgi:nicotinate-nucleotide pyrophosphorylase (carboxylating)